jgi:type II secretory pathway pseudopilin PulG
MKDFIVRIAILVVVAVVVMAFIGWIRFDRTADRATIEVQTTEMEQAAERAARSGRELLQDTKEAIHEATEPREKRVEPAPAPATTDLD